MKKLIMMHDRIISDIRLELQRASSILLVSHVRPDGDAIGSVMALSHALEAVGKKTQVVLQDGVPSSLKYLDGTRKVKNRVEDSFDLLISLDCSDFERVGDILDENRIPDINIDHHITNTKYGRLNLVDIEAVATSEILAVILPDLNLPLTRNVADALITGIITDTIGFRTSNMTPRALRVSADLMEAGARLTELYNLSLVRRSFEAVHLWGMGLARLQREGPIIWTSLTLADKKLVHYNGRDDADLINNLAAIDDAIIAIIFVEQDPNVTKVSWRAQLGWDVAKIAAMFGGGGHTAAAGAEIEGTLNEVQEKVLKKTLSVINEER
jgi:bifunctional oligoribonuclease and PAP phosphatase NrnA